VDISLGFPEPKWPVSKLEALKIPRVTASAGLGKKIKLPLKDIEMSKDKSPESLDPGPSLTGSSPVNYLEAVSMIM